MTSLVEQLGISNDELIERAVNKIAEDFLNIDASGMEDDPEEEESAYTTQKRIGKKLKEMMASYFDAEFQKYAAQHVQPTVEETVREWTFRETNTWGESKGNPKTLGEYLENKCNDWLKEKVDASGRTEKEARSYSGQWREAGNRISILISAEVSKHISAAMTDIMKHSSVILADAMKDAVDAKMLAVKESVLKVK